jgi:hypothetical protein
VRFWLGTDMPGWLAHAGVPLFVSRRPLSKYKTLPRAVAPWALDSGGFTELNLYGRWETSPEQYAREVRLWHSEVGSIAFASQQDWMCEEVVCASTALEEGLVSPDRAKFRRLVEKLPPHRRTPAALRRGRVLACLPLHPPFWAGRIRVHQERTVENYLRLRNLAPDLPWLPVLQGWERADYQRHLDQWAGAGVDLAAVPLAGLGSVCRRQGTRFAEDVIRELHGMGVRVHAFGFKVAGLRLAAPYLESADSMAWSFNARRGTPLPGCPHRKCNRCSRYALAWRERVLGVVSRSLACRQPTLFA